MKAIEKLMDGREAARKLDIAYSTLRLWEKKGKGPNRIKIGRKVYYTESLIAQWLKGRLEYGDAPRKANSEDKGPLPERKRSDLPKALFRIDRGRLALIGRHPGHAKG